MVEKKKNASNYPKIRLRRITLKMEFFEAPRLILYQLKKHKNVRNKPK